MRTSRRPGVPSKLLSSSTETVKVFSPATIANVGPGFDIFGMAIKNLGDTVKVSRTKEKGLRIDNIVNDLGVPYAVDENTAGIAAKFLLEKYEKTRELKKGIEISINKGVPPRGGLGSSAASAVASAVAVNHILDSPFGQEELIQAALLAETTVSGNHADNIIPSLVGGFTIISNAKTLRYTKIAREYDLNVVVIIPELDISTKKSRQLVPSHVPLSSVVENSANIALMVNALNTGDLKEFYSSIHDSLIEPVRSNLIEGYTFLKQSAIDAGALAGGISGSGPSLFFITNGITHSEEIGHKIVSTWKSLEVEAKAYPTKIDYHGSRIL